MPTFDPKDYEQAYETIAEMVKELARPSVNWVFWIARPARHARDIMPANWDGWLDLAIPCPYRNSASQHAWKAGYCYFYADGPYWHNPYTARGSRGVNYAWRHGWVTAQWSINQEEQLTMEMLNAHLREGVNSGKLCRRYDRKAKDWLYWLAEKNLEFPPVIWKEHPWASFRTSPSPERSRTRTSRKPRTSSSTQNLGPTSATS
jgi:hypothetical protein